MSKLAENTVQHTLCMPLCGRMIAAQKYPGLFPDRDAERIVRELGEDISGRAMYRLQYMWINCESIDLSLILKSAAGKSAVLFILPLTTNFVSAILIIRLSVI